MEVYLPRCLTPTLITRLCSPREAWGIVRGRAKKLRISEAFLPLWACLRGRLLMDYVGDLYLHLFHLMTPSQSEALTKTRVSLLQQLLPALSPTLKASVPDQISSSHFYKLILPPSPAKKLLAALQETNRPDLHRPLAAMMNTSPRTSATAINTKEQNPGSAPKTPTITFFQH